MTTPDVLVIEPDPTTRGLLLRGLRESGLNPVGAATGREALAHLESFTPSLVISEAELPDVDGGDLVDHLRARKRTSEVPFYFLTHSDALGVDEARRLGAQDLLRKPAFIRDLVTLGHLHGGQPASAQVLESRFEYVGPAHLLRALASGGRSGRVTLLDGEGEVAFHRGRVVDVWFRERAGREAFLPILTLVEGPFQVSFEEDLPSTGALNITVDELLREGFPYVQRWEQVRSHLYPLDTALVVNFRRLADKLETLPDAVNGLLRLCDGRRSIEEVVVHSELNDLTALEVIAKLDAVGILEPADDVTAPQAPFASATPAADDLLASLFSDIELPMGDSALAALPVTDWFDDYEKGKDPWDVILPDQPATQWEVQSLTGDGADGWNLAEAAARAAQLHGTEFATESLLDAPLGDFVAPGVPDAGFAEDVEAFFSSPVTRPVEPIAPIPHFAWIFAGAVIVIALMFAGIVSLNTGSAPEVASVGTEMVLELDAFDASPKSATETRAARLLAAEEAIHLSMRAQDGTVVLVDEETVPVPAGTVLTGENGAMRLDPIEVSGADDPIAAALEDALASYELGRYEDAIDGYSSVVATYPDVIAAHLGLGLTYLDTGRTQSAIRSFERARQLDPDSARAALLVGTGFQVAERDQEARSAYGDYLRLAPRGEHADDVRQILAADWE